MSDTDHDEQREQDWGEYADANPVRGWRGTEYTAFVAGRAALIAEGYRKPVAVEGDAKDTLENLRRRADDKPGAIFNPAYDVGARFWFRKAADVIESQAAASARVRQWDRWRDARLFGDEGTPYSNGARDAHKAIVAILDASPEKGGQD